MEKFYCTLINMKFIEEVLKKFGFLKNVSYIDICGVGK
jgi:hypothetical protein